MINVNKYLENVIESEIAPAPFHLQPQSGAFGVMPMSSSNECYSMIDGPHECFFFFYLNPNSVITHSIKAAPPPPPSPWMATLAILSKFPQIIVGPPNKAPP